LSLGFLADKKVLPLLFFFSPSASCYSTLFISVLVGIERNGIMYWNRERNETRAGDVAQQ
jgi:hypothetical protein